MVRVPENPSSSIAITADSIRGEAMAVAKILDKDTVLAAAIATGLDALAESKRTALPVMVRMLADLGAEKMALLPVPGSEKKDTNRPDKYETTGPNAKGETVKQVGSFYGDLFNATKEGRDIAVVVEGLQKAKTNATDTPDDYKGMSTFDCNQALTEMNQRKAAGKAVYSKAGALYLKLAELKEAFPNFKIGYSLLSDKSGPSTSTVPMFIGEKDADGPDKSKAFSIGAFIKLNAVKALADGGKIEDLWFSGGNATSDDEEDEDDGFQIKGAEGFETATASYAGWLDEIDNIQTVYKLLKAKAPDGAYTNDDLLASLWKIKTELVSIFAKEDYSKRAAALEATDQAKAA